jgi:protein gp37
MAKDSKIEWCDHTANIFWGCVSVHEGCDNCYAEKLSHRWGNDVWGNDKPRKEIKSVWKDLIKFQKLAKEANEIHTVFVGSMMDIFEKPMPLIDSDGNEVQGKDTGFLRDLFFQQISAGIYPNLMFLLLTKRPSNINKYIPESWKTSPPNNVMFGTSPVNQETADKLIPQLLRVKGRKFLSVEPQLSELSLADYLWTPTNYCEECGTGGLHLKKPCDNICGFKPINWIINGGESGHGKRPFNTDWARKLKEECAYAGVPFFFKQIDKIQAIPKDLEIRQLPIYN